MSKKLFDWLLDAFVFIWVHFIFIIFFAAACAIFIETREYLHALIEIIADFILWFWGLHWSILIPVLIVLSAYTVHLIKHRRKKPQKDNEDSNTNSHYLK